MFDWNDLRHFLAVARHAGLAGAARDLRVSQSTVLRRVSALEQQLGHRLFDRLPSGYVLAPEGREMLALALRVEEEVLALDRAMAGRCGAAAGPLRVATSDVLAQTILCPHLARFCQDHPEIKVELLVGDEYVDLARREADMAFRIGRPAQNSLYGRRVTVLGWAVYGAPCYLARRPLPETPTPEDLEDHDFVGFAGKMAGIAQAMWLTDRIPDWHIVYRTNSLLHLSHLVRLGLGLGLLPRTVGDDDPLLVRVMPSIPGLEREAWLVTHEDLKQNSRVQCFLREVGRAVAAERHRHLGPPELAVARPEPAGRDAV